jgi:multidrug transporter EmrE-like cation transporter
MAKSTSKRAAVKPPAKRRKRGAFGLYLNRVLRFAARVNWPSTILRGVAFAALVAVGAAVSITVGTHAGDMITAVILVCTAILAELGIVLGPQVLHKVRGAARVWTKATIGVCIALACWNLSTSLHNADVAHTAVAVRAADTYEADLVRLTSLPPHRRSLR